MPPPPSKPAPLKLIFTSTSIQNVTIATKSDEHYYEVVTWDWDPFLTKIRRLIPESTQMVPIAELKKDEGNDRKRHSGVKMYNPDKPDSEFESPEVFLGITSSEPKLLGTFTSLNGACCRWQINKGAIELVPINEPEGKILARYHRHHRYLGVFRVSEFPYLEVDPELAPSMDNLIVSFLLVEERHRRGAQK